MAKLSAVFNSQVVDENGDPAVGWQIETYAANSSTPLATYTDAAGTVAQSNPIILNALGLPENGAIWLTEGLTYKFVLKDAGGTVKDTKNNISGVNDSSVDVSQWQASGQTPTYVSATSFTLAGDQTSEFHVGRRVQCTVTAGTVYGRITSSVFAALTTVTIELDSGALDAGLSAVNLSILRADYPALPTMPTATAGDSSKKIANTEFVGTAVATAKSEAAPPGEIAFFARNTAPTGWLKANGAVLSISSYEALATAIYCGDANNATAAFGFKCTDQANPGTSRSTSGTYIVLPDLRGEFIRAWDDGRGIDSGRAFGSAQSDELKSHAHNISNMGTQADTNVSGASGRWANTGGTYTTQSTGGSETRPRNIALLACIKF